MKKTALLLTLVLIVGLLSACGSADNSSSGGDATTAPTTSAEATNTPTTAPTDTPTPSPTPTPEANIYLKCDFDSAPVGFVLDDAEEDIVATIKDDPTCVYLLFSQIGAAYADFGEGVGMDGTNCLKATGRNGTWHGIALNIDPKWYGKGFEISFDAKCVSMKDGVTDMLVSCTTQFQPLKEDGSAGSTVYPAYNRATGTSSDGAWVHCENTVFLPTDIAEGTARIYFECADGKGKEDILIDNLSIKIVDGVGDYAAFEAYWEEHAPVEEEGEE